MRFHGIIPPVVTPMRPDEELDLVRLKWFLDYLLERGVHALFVLGTNSEFYALDDDEKQAVVATAVQHVAGRAPVIAGTGAATTRQALRLTKMAEREGADGVSVITPYFIHPNQQEMAEYYRRVAEATALPLMLYNNPEPCGIRLAPETVARLCERCPTIVAIKDSSGDLQNTIDYLRVVPDRVAVFQGRDTLIYATLACGGHGAVAASANVAPALCVEIYEAFQRGDHFAARAAQERLHPVRLSLLLGTAPGGPKAALRVMGVDLGPSRAPILQPTAAQEEQMRSALRQAGLLQS